MAGRAQERARQTSAPLSIEPKRGKPQQAIVEHESLRRLYTIVLKCTIVGERSTKSLSPTIAQAAATIELTGKDAIVAATDNVVLELLRAPLTLSQNFSDGIARGAPKLIPREGAGTSHLAIAAGVALGEKLGASQGIVVAIASGDTVSSGASFEALNYASAHKLPLVILVDNTVFAPSTVRPDLLTIAQAHGVPAFMVDGQDAVAVYRVAREANHRARSGRGPSLIECRSSAMIEHPLLHLERYLQKHGLWTPEWKRQIAEDAGTELGGRDQTSG